MKDPSRTKQSLIEEMTTLRKRVADMERVESGSKRAEEALRESEGRYKRLLDSVTDYIYTVQVEDGCPVATVHGPGCAAVTGYSPEDYQADPYLWHHMIYTQDRDIVTAHAARVIVGEKAIALEHRIVHRDGSVLWVRNTPVPHYDEGRRLVAYDGLISNITERKRAEEALREKTALLSGLLASIPDIVFFKDKEGVYLGCNPEFARFVGQDTPSIVGSTDYDLFSKEIADFFREQDRIMMDQGEPRHNEEWIEYPDGARVRIDTLKATLRDVDGQVIGMLGVSRDITERKRLETTKDDFVSMVSHELRTPIAVIKETIALVLEEVAGPVGGEQRELMSAAKRNVDRLARLINDVLDLQKLQAGQVEFRPAAEDVAEIVGEVHAFMLPVAREKGLALEKAAADLPRVVLDRDKILQVLTNLVSNAIKFTDRGSVVISASRGDDGGVLFSVADTGIGIRAEDISKLFKAFSQVSACARWEKGSTGLGLVISKEIVTAHGGRIWAESEPGKGSTFRVLLPAEVDVATYGQAMRNAAF
jgi:PAS domain S-box-containing protein